MVSISGAPLESSVYFTMNKATPFSMSMTIQAITEGGVTDDMIVNFIVCGQETFTPITETRYYQFKVLELEEEIVILNEDITSWFDLDITGSHEDC